jgi:hypothetical protein
MFHMMLQRLLCAIATQITAEVRGASSRKSWFYLCKDGSSRLVSSYEQILLSVCMHGTRHGSV